MRVRLLSINEKSLVLRIWMSGETCIVKAFDPEYPKAAQAFEREVGVYQTLADTGLIPGIRAANRAEGVMVVEYVEGRSLTAALHDGDPNALAQLWGQWLAEFTRGMPTRSAETTWFDYLQNYDLPALQTMMVAQQDSLKAAPIHALGIAQNDAFPDNFIVTPGGTFCGLDFEAASLKPVGWDLLLAARILGLRFPDRIADVTHHLLDGWGRPVGAVPVRDFAPICALFAQAAVRAGDVSRGRA